MNPSPKPTTGRSRYPRWTLKDGTRVRIEDMSDDHLLRAIAYLIRKAKKHYPIYLNDAYAACGYADNESMGFSLDAAIERLEQPDGWKECLHHMYEYLVMEANRRGLEVES